MNLTSCAGSMIISYLGPCKSNKLIVDGNEIYITKCPQLLLEKAVFTDHFSYIIEDTLRSHHQQFGCSTTTLLAMWYFWNEEFHTILQEGYNVSDIVEHSQEIIINIVSSLPQIVINIKQTIFCNSKSGKMKRTFLQHSSQSQSSIFKPAIMSTFDGSISSSKLASIIPTGVRYSSRHYSPSQTNLQITETDTITSKINGDNYMEMNEELQKALFAIVQKLSHDDSESAKLISDLWIRQISLSGGLKFCVDGIIILPLTLPCSYTSVVDGLIVKSKSFSWHDQEICLENKTLIIRGSITFEYAHLGYISKVSTTRKLTPQELLISEKDNWIKECCELLTKLQVNIVLVHGTVDADVCLFCSSHGILLLSDIPWKQLEIISLAVKTSPCTYLLDCDTENIVENLKVMSWKPDFRLMNRDKFFKISLNSVSKIKPCTVILCHPNSAFLKCQEHQLWHLASRLELATLSEKLLPGSGKTEVWCCQLLERFTFVNDSKTKICQAIAIGFKRYCDFVQKKIELKENPTQDEALDEMQSKIQAWKSAMALTVLTLQCDSMLINETDNTNVFEFNDNLIGFL